MWVFIMLIPVFAMRPVLGLVNGWHFKLPVTFTCALLWQSAGTKVAEPVAVLERLPELFRFHPTLMAMAVSLLVLDTVTGVSRVLWFEGLGGIRSNKLRLFGWKLIEYGGVLFCCLVLANGTAETWGSPLFGWLDEGGPIYISVTEAVSIAENITRKDAGAGRILHDAKDMALGDWEALMDRHVNLSNSNGEK